MQDRIFKTGVLASLGRGGVPTIIAKQVVFDVGAFFVPIYGGRIHNRSSAQGSFIERARGQFGGDEVGQRLALHAYTGINDWIGGSSSKASEFRGGISKMGRQKICHKLSEIVAKYCMTFYDGL